MERNREIAAELLKQGKKVWLSFMYKAQAACLCFGRPTETESACAMALSSCETFTVANKQDKALLALKRRKMQGKLIEKTDDQVTAGPHVDLRLLPAAASACNFRFWHLARCPFRRARCHRNVPLGHRAERSWGNTRNARIVLADIQT